MKLTNEQNQQIKKIFLDMLSMDIDKMLAGWEKGDSAPYEGSALVDMADLIEGNVGMIRVRARQDRFDEIPGDAAMLLGMNAYRAFQGALSAMTKEQTARFLTDYKWMCFKDGMTAKGEDAEARIEAFKGMSKYP